MWVSGLGSRALANAFELAGGWGERHGVDWGFEGRRIDIGSNKSGELRVHGEGGGDLRVFEAVVEGRLLCSAGRSSETKRKWINYSINRDVKL